MGKDIFSLAERRESSVDRYCLLPDPSLGDAAMDPAALREILASGDVKAFLVAALSAIRRERGRCAPEEGMDCVLRFSLPLAAGAGDARGWFLAAGFRDAELYTPAGVLLQWSDARGGVSWDTVDMLRTECLRVLAAEVDASLGMLGR